MRKLLLSAILFLSMMSWAACAQNLSSADREIKTAIQNNDKNSLKSMV